MQEKVQENTNQQHFKDNSQTKKIALCMVGLVLVVLVIKLCWSDNSVKKSELLCSKEEGVEVCTNLKFKPYSGYAFSKYDDNKLAEKLYYKKGKREGVYKHYFKNGKLHLEEHYKKGILNGINREYSAKGILSADANFKDGELHGTVKLFYDDGQLRSEMNYKQGKPYGTFKEYYPNGKLKSKGKFKDEIPESMTCYSGDGDELNCALVY